MTLDRNAEKQEVPVNPETVRSLSLAGDTFSFSV